jgi:hexosaminidase
VRWLIFGLLVCASAAPVLGNSPAVDVIPAPARVTSGEGVFAFRADTWISLPRDPGVARIARYFGDLLEQTRGVHLRPLSGKEVTSAFQAVIVFRLDRSTSGMSPEAYEIKISSRQVVVSAADPRGLFYGAVTLWQLCTAKTTDAAHITLHAGDISDSPRLPWRGLMLDSARHYQTPQFVMRFIDWMALHKLNVLHWHLTDDQGWRLEIKKYPRLTEVGAWRVPAGGDRLYGGFYSQDDVRRIVAHAAERNITIVPEIDMPGHASAAIAAYPQLGVTDHPPTSVPSDWGIYPDLYNVEDSTFSFLDDVLDEVIALFPGKYIHVGGDEAVKDQWKASARVQARMRELHIADEHALQSYFVQRIEQHLNARGIAPDATVMSWRGLDGAVAAVAAGHDAVLSPWPTLYFDNRQGTGASEPPGRGRVLPLREVYDFDPMPAGIAPDRQQHVLGLQANIWTEHIRTEDRVAYMTFPRAAAVAETGWSTPRAHNWDDFVRRLPSQFARYRAVGLRYSDDALRPADTHELGPFDRHMSQDLRTCTDKLVLALEDDAPARGNRAVFLIDIMNPCWIFPSVDLSRGLSLRTAVGQVPFNFQIGKDRDAIQLAPPQTAAGELEIYLDGCTKDRVAVLPLAPAAGNNAVTELPSVRLPATPGRHDLCFRFTQRTLDPLWALDWVQLQE